MTKYGENVKQSKTDKRYDDWFLRTVDSALIRFQTKQFSTSEALLAACGYVQTITFNQRFAAMRKDARELGRSDTTIEFDTFHGGYVEITKYLVNERRYHHSTFAHLWPMAFVGIDFEGSKNSEPTEFKANNLHVHAIWCVHPDVKDRFDTFVGATDLKERFMSYGPCDAVEFKPYEKPKSGSHTYGIKAHTKTLWTPSSVEDMRIYPHPKYAGRKIGWRNEGKQADLGDLRQLQIAVRVQTTEEQAARMPKRRRKLKV